MIPPSMKPVHDAVDLKNVATGKVPIVRLVQRFRLAIDDLSTKKDVENYVNLSTRPPELD
jgi:hypothetical protein